MSLDIAYLRLQFTDSSLKLCHGCTSSSDRIFISFGEFVFQLHELALQSPFGLGLAAGVILFRTEFISKSSSVNHGFLGLLFRTLSLLEHVINLSMHGVHGALDGPLIAGSS